MQCIHRYAVLNPNEVRLSELIYSAVMLVTEIAGWMMMYRYVIKYVNTLSVAPHGDYDKIGLSCLHPLGNSKIPTWN